MSILYAVSAVLFLLVVAAQAAQPDMELPHGVLTVDDFESLYRSIPSPSKTSVHEDLFEPLATHSYFEGNASDRIMRELMGKMVSDEVLSLTREILEVHESVTARKARSQEGGESLTTKVLQGLSDVLFSGFSSSSSGPERSTRKTNFFADQGTSEASGEQHGRKLWAVTGGNAGVTPPGGYAIPSAGNVNTFYFQLDSVPLLSSFDWTTNMANIFPPPQDQGPSCQSCWIIVTADLIAATWQLYMYAVVYGKDVATWIPQGLWAWPLSAQYICDCGFKGSCCGGGWPQYAVDFVTASNGLPPTSEYLYAGQDSQSCKRARPRYFTAPVGWGLVPAFNTDYLKKAVSTLPVIAFLSSTGDFFSYTGGIYNGTCSMDVNHAVLVVGFGIDNGVPYWRVRSSRSSTWSENGYMRIIMLPGGGKCGMTSLPAIYATYSIGYGIPCPAFPPPCGAGTCYNAYDPYVRKFVARCQCPDYSNTLVNGVPINGGKKYVENYVGGQAKCVSSTPCQDAGAVNPCGVGTCTNLSDGSYSCDCTKNVSGGSITGYITGAHVSGAPTCTSSGSTGGMQTYTIKPVDTCDTICNAYNITLSSLQVMNPAVASNCSNLLPGATLAVPSRAIACGISYVPSQFDTCTTISQKFLISQSQLAALNPSFDCVTTQPIRGVSMCAAPAPVTNAPIVGNPCTATYTTGSTDTCATIVNTLNLDMPTLKGLNPEVIGLCDPGFNMIGGLQLCFSTKALNMSCTGTVSVGFGATCVSIWTQYNLTATQFFTLNPGVRCNRPYFLQSQTLCIASAAISQIPTGLVPYYPAPGQTLQAIVSQFQAMCGISLSVNSTAVLNNLVPDPNFTPATFTSLLLPCTNNIGGRDCGCGNRGPSVLGSDGNIHVNYCQANCNWATPVQVISGDWNTNYCQVWCPSIAGVYWPGLVNPAPGHMCSAPCPLPSYPPQNYWGAYYSSPCFYACDQCNYICTNSGQNFYGYCGQMFFTTYIRCMCRCWNANQVTIQCYAPLSGYCANLLMWGNDPNTCG